MNCRIEPAPGYWIGYNTTPPINPPNYYYECDGLPATATPPMTTCGSYGTYTLIASGGLLHFKRISGSGTQFCCYKWTFINANHIIIEESHPRMDTDYSPAGSMAYAEIDTGGVFVVSYKQWKAVGGIMIIQTSYTGIGGGGMVTYLGPYTDYTITELIKNPVTNKWSVYLNGTLRGSGLTLTPTTADFYLAGATGVIYIDLDFYRMWLNIPRE